MDVTLVLTHRCNLACRYCYAGEHFRKEMDDETIERGLDLLYADRADVAQLSFFGGEPFLAFESMRRAVAGAQQRARTLGRRLLLQCTTNGTVMRPEQVAFVLATHMRVTVSIDGVQEAHDMMRPNAGGASSFEWVHAGLRALIQTGAHPDAMMVITPETAPFAFRSVSWLWSEGVDTVRANLSLGSEWSDLARAELREELQAIGLELLARRLRGEAVSFQPFDAGLCASGGIDRGPDVRARDLDRAASAISPSRCGAARSRLRGQLVVGATGHLYPCAPMVGEDRDDGAEARQRIGHIRNEVHAIVARVVSDGAGCGDGRACACAAYLETGDRTTGGPQGVWFGKVCAELGAAVGAGLEEARRRGTAPPLAAPLPPPEREERDPLICRRPLLLGLALAASGLVLGGAAMLGSSLFVTQGGLASPRVVPPSDRDRRAPAGGLSEPVPPPPPDPHVDGNMVPPPPPPTELLPLPRISGGVAGPPRPPRVTPRPKSEPPKSDPEERVHVRGLIARPPSER
jgi:uncharacterized protein